MNICVSTLLLTALGLVAGSPEETKIPATFDFEHVEGALAYFDRADEEVLLRIAESRATEHLLAHSERTGYYPAGTSGLELSRTLLNDPAPEEWRIMTVRGLISYLQTDTDRQADCLAEAKKYLPERVELVEPLHLTWGYDIGVAMDGSASLNLAHDHFLEDREELWFYCIHEMHHAGVMSLHPMAEIGGIATIKQLLKFVRYSTFLEGTATYAAHAARAQAGAIGKDRDYVALADEGRMDRYRANYFERYGLIESEPDRELQESDWRAIEDFSDGDRLWYRVGAEMAATIDENLGRERLVASIAEGPDAFFSAYFESMQ